MGNDSIGNGLFNRRSFDAFWCWCINPEPVHSAGSNIVILYFIGHLLYGKIQKLQPQTVQSGKYPVSKIVLMTIQLIGLNPILAELKLDNVWLYLQNWWLWLAITGVMLGSAFSVKFVGLFVILLVSVKDVS